MKILLVDDHILFRQGISTLLAAQPDMTVVGEAASVAEAVEKARALKPDTILMDISLPDGAGFDAAEQILAELPGTHIVFLTVHEDDDRLFRAVKSGARGYLLKNMRTAQLLDMLRGLERGEAALPRQLATRILVEFARMRTQLDTGQPAEDEAQLTPRETEILKLAAEGAATDVMKVSSSRTLKSIKTD